MQPVAEMAASAASLRIFGSPSERVRWMVRRADLRVHADAVLSRARRVALRRIALTMSLAAGCATHSPAPRPPGSDAAQRLRSIGDRYWDALLATTTLPALNQNGIGYLGGPLYATSIGDHRFDDQLDDLSPEAHARLLADLAALKEEADRLPTAGLNPVELISLQMLREQLSDAQGAEACQIV